jgi:hypothetical protein
MLMFARILLNTIADLYHSQAVLEARPGNCDPKGGLSNKGFKSRSGRGSIEVDMDKPIYIIWTYIPQA